LTKQFYSNGKLLLTGEYVVLDGAKALAIPSNYGQSLSVTSINSPFIHWKSFDKNNNLWFETSIALNKIDSLKLSNLSSENLEIRLLQILKSAKTLNPFFLNNSLGFIVETHLSFAKEWGLGTSSTLINNIAQWAKVDAYKLLELTFGGSGYDIACAQNGKPITYQIINKLPNVQPVNFNPNFKDWLYFVYLNKKQNSREAIFYYNLIKNNISSEVSEINNITQNMISCYSFSEFQYLIKTHETIIAKITKQTPVKDLFFNDFNSSIKSLGAWGGDFILVASEENPEAYFKSKGLSTIIPFNEMILKSLNKN